jgi:K+-sensing histidine kinase KdpD
MNRQREFMSEVIHTLAQPVTALRVSVELGLQKNASGQAAHLEDCLQLIDRLMQELAVFREIASLDEAPALQSCDGQALLEDCVQELALVAEAGGIALHLDAGPAILQCDTAMFQRAIFVLLDEMIATAAPGSEISIALCSREDGYLLEMRPGTTSGQRQKLCHKLMELAGGSGIRSTAGNTSMNFRKGSYRSIPAIALADKRLLTSDLSFSRIGPQENIS